jgi:hypothetical protein
MPLLAIPPWVIPINKHTGQPMFPALNQPESTRVLAEQIYIHYNHPKKEVNLFDRMEV